MPATSGDQSPSDEPSRKRCRVDSSEEPTAPLVHHDPYTRDPTYWYDDGNIIVIAQKVGFRIYKGILARHSDVFRDMFSIPQPTPDRQRGDCPVMHVTESAAEMRSLLSILLDGQRYIPWPFEDIVIAIRLAHKYAMSSVFVPAVEELKRYFPADFNSWDRRLTTPHPRHAIVALNLTRLVDIPSILPAAFYLCCQLDGRKLMGLPDADGAAPEVADTLMPEDLARCINGRDALWGRRAVFLSDLFKKTKRSPGCATALKADVGSPWECQRSQEDIWHDQQTLDHSRDLLAPWGRLIREHLRTKTSDNPLCPACVVALCEQEKRLRRWEWTWLRGLFDLEDADDTADGRGTPVFSVSSDSDGA